MFKYIFSIILILFGLFYFFGIKNKTIIEVKQHTVSKKEIIEEKNINFNKKHIKKIEKTITNINHEIDDNIDIKNNIENEEKRMVLLKIGGLDYKYSKDISNEFRLEVNSYEDSYVPLDTLPATKSLCYSAEYLPNSQGSIITRYDDYGAKRKYSCNYTWNDIKNPTFKWEEIY